MTSLMASVRLSSLLCLMRIRISELTNESVDLSFYSVSRTSEALLHMLDLSSDLLVLFRQCFFWFYSCNFVRYGSVWLFGSKRSSRVLNYNRYCGPVSLETYSITICAVPFSETAKWRSFSFCDQLFMVEDASKYDNSPDKNDYH